MSNNVHAWPKPAGRADSPLPAPITRPCDWGLRRAIEDSVELFDKGDGFYLFDAVKFDSQFSEGGC